MQDSGGALPLAAQAKPGHAVYALKQAQDVATYKAVSMNLMHADLSVTDRIYAVLNEEDVRERIASLTRLEMDAEPSSQLRRAPAPSDHDL